MLQLHFFFAYLKRESILSLTSVRQRVDEQASYDTDSEKQCEAARLSRRFMPPL